MKVKNKIMDEQGVALITVIVVSAVLMVIGGGMYFMASREGNITQADYVGSQAFYYAEGGIENVIDILNYTATEEQLTRPREDQSSNGYGFLMDPDPALRQDPPDPVQMRIGKETYTVWVDEVDQYGNHCVNCGLNLTTTNPAYLLITAEGQSAEGYRKLQQRVKVEASGYPLMLYVDGDAQINGNPTISSQSIYVKGNLYGREKVSITGTDLVFGGPAAVFATGSIYAKANGGNSQIYTNSGDPNNKYWSDDYRYDRDSRGPSGNTFTLAELNDKFQTAGLTTSQLLALKGMAQTSGYYANPTSGGITIQQSDIPSFDGNIVIYVEYSSGSPNSNEVGLKFTWPVSPYTDGQALVVIKNGSAKLTGQAIGNLQGSIYCPDGEVTADGGGTGNFTGFIWGKGMIDIGNFPFHMNGEFLADPPFFAWTVVRETAWTEVDG